MCKRIPLFKTIFTEPTLFVYPQKLCLLRMRRRLLIWTRPNLSLPWMHRGCAIHSFHCLHVIGRKRLIRLAVCRLLIWTRPNLPLLRMSRSIHTFDFQHTSGRKRLIRPAICRLLMWTRPNLPFRMGRSSHSFLFQDRTSLQKCHWINKTSRFFRDRTKHFFQSHRLSDIVLGCILA